MDVGPVLAMLEEASAETDVRPALALLAAPELALDEAELRPAVRRSSLLLAARGDPHRDPDLDGRAVTALASELALPERIAALERGLVGLRPVVAALPNVAAALEELLAEPQLAWRAYAGALLADALTE